MNRSDNYPDDIRSWDWHPGSPFYREPPEPHCVDCAYQDCPPCKRPEQAEDGDEACDGFDPAYDAYEPDDGY